MNKKKLATSVAAITLAAAVLTGGTLAWQSVSQTAVNEASDVINPGGRLHDDFNGTNKDIYVENFADEPIFARIRLAEYLELTANMGTDAERKRVVIGDTDSKTGSPIYDIRYFHEPDPSENYWRWTTGGSTVYMPTFNCNKDSLAADVNGTYAGLDGLSELPNEDRYLDYVAYKPGYTLTGTVILDADTNSSDEVGTDFDDLEKYADSGSIILLEGVTHTAKKTDTAEFIGMDEWLAMVDENYNSEDHGGYWVYDEDGWIYWSEPIMPGTATGLLLDSVELARVMGDTWYYAIEVTAQFVTADDIGKTDDSGFYDTAAGSAPTASAERLLEYITGYPLLSEKET